MTEDEVYAFYNEKVKVIYSEIEARNNSIPVELLFEISAAFDHLKRIHIDGESEDECSLKAFSHLKRGLLDAFKLKLKYHNEDFKSLMSQKSDLRLVDNGNYLPSLLKDRGVLLEVARNARLEEGKQEVDEAFDLWFEVSLKIDDFEAKYFDPNKINWARRNNFLRLSRDFVIGLITGIISSGIIAFIISAY